MIIYMLNNLLYFERMIIKFIYNSLIITNDQIKEDIILGLIEWK